MSIAENLNTLLQEIEREAKRVGRDPAEILLIGVSKGCSLEAIEEAYTAGLRDFGENRVQEAIEKRLKTPSSIRWHFIGKLQRNKVNKIIGLFSLIHSVDSLELAEKISDASLKSGIRTAILLEVNTSREETKSGFSPEQVKKTFPKILNLKGIDLSGLMTMAPLTSDEKRIRQCFSELRLLCDDLQSVAQERANLSTLSMGMTHDYRIAIQEGATLLRIGRGLFHELKNRL